MIMNFVNYRVVILVGRTSNCHS